MKIRPFHVEQWIDRYEATAKYNIAETCVNPMTLDELFALTGEDKDAFIQRMFSTQMTYGPIEGGDQFRDGVSKLFKTVKPDEVLLFAGLPICGRGQSPQWRQCRYRGSGECGVPHRSAALPPA